MKKNKKLIIALILMLVIGFASVSTTLVLTGVVGIGENKDDFKVIFTKAKLNGVAKNNFIDKNTKQTITYETDVLSLVDDTSVLEYEVTNTSRNYDADVAIDLEVPENDYVYIEFEPKTMFIEAGKSKSGSVTVKLKGSITEEKTISIKCGFKSSAKKRESLGEEYVAPFSKSGVMMAAAVDSESYEPTGKFWQYRDNITQVVFENEMNPHETKEELTFDVSEKQDGSVMAYLAQPNFTEEEKNKYAINFLQADMGMTIEEYKKYAIERGMTEEEFDAEIKSALEEVKQYIFSDSNYTLYVQSNTGVKANPNSSALFCNFKFLIDIVGLEYFDTSAVTDMSGMFYGLNIISNIDLSSFDTSNVTNMSGMFADCKALTTLDLSNFDTSKVTDMSGMFSGCISFSSLDLSSFNTSNVTNMASMFWGEFDNGNADSLKFLNISNFDTSKVTNMSRMFGCRYILTDLDLSNFDTSNVTDMTSMFWCCYHLINLNIKSFDTSKVIDMSNMFSDCYGLTNLELNNFNTSNVVSMSTVFANCYNLEKIDISNFDTSNVTSMAGMFKSCNSLTELDISNFDTSKVTDMSNMFWDCEKLLELDLSNFNTSSLVRISNMFCKCTNLKRLDLSNFVSDNLTYIEENRASWGIFEDCNNLVELNISKLDFSKFNSFRDYRTFENMPLEAVIIVKDEAVRSWILGLSGFNRPSWGVDNIIIAS